MKSKEELNALKEEVEAVNRKLAELTEEELVQVSGGNPSAQPNTDNPCPNNYTECSRENCMNPVCEHLRVDHFECFCDKLVSGGFRLGVSLSKNP